MNKAGSRKWWALAALTLAVLAIGLDGTVLSVAVPTLATALNASESDLQWFSSGYLLVLAAAMLPAGLLGDRYGRKKVMMGSLVLFGIGSAACAYAQTAGEFIAARVVLGLAGAGIVVMALSALTVLFTDEERPRAVGIWAAANFLALPIGPIFGGWLLTNFWWGWVFLVNVPVALVGLLATLALVPESRAPVRPKLDLVGISLSTAGLLGLTYGLIEAGQSGWGAENALIPIGVGLGLLVAFFLWERFLSRRPGAPPLIDLSLFRSASFTWGVVLLAILGLAMIGVLFTMPQYFQGVVGVDAQESGIRLLPLIGGLVLGALVSARIAKLLGAKITVAIGFVVLAGGMLLGSTTDMLSTGGFAAAWMAIAGLGLGTTLATGAAGALAELSAETAGVGSAVLQALQKVGAPFGTAILGSVLLSTYQAQVQTAGLPAAAASLVKTGLFGGLAVARQIGSTPLQASVRAAFVDGMDASLVVAAGIGALGCLLALLFLPSHPRAKTESTASEGGVETAVTQAPAKAASVS